MSPTGSFAGFTSNAKSGSTSFTALAPSRTSLTLGPSYRFGSSFFDFSMLNGATRGRMERGAFTVSGSTIQQNFLGRTFEEGGSPTTASGSRPGTFTVNLNGTLDMNVNGQLLGGFALGDNADFLVQNLISYTSFLQLRSNLTPQVGLGRDFNTGTASAGATGAFSPNLGTDLWTGGLTGDGCFGFALEGADTDAPTAMRIGIFMNF